MAEFLYPKVISIDTVPTKGKHYAFRFTWEATEPISKESVGRAFDFLFSYFESTYKVFISHSITGTEGAIGPEVAFVTQGQLSITLRDMWNWFVSEAKDVYLDLTLYKTILYRPRWPWWVWLLLASGGIGTIIAIVKRKK